MMHDSMRSLCQAPPTEQAKHDLQTAAESSLKQLTHARTFIRDDAGR